MSKVKVDFRRKDSGIYEENNSPGIGRQCFTVTDLQPAGKIEIDSEIYEAFALTGFIKRGSKIEVVHSQNSKLFVRKI